MTPAFTFLGIFLFIRSALNALLLTLYMKKKVITAVKISLVQIALFCILGFLMGTVFMIIVYFSRFFLVSPPLMVDLIISNIAIVSIDTIAQKASHNALKEPKLTLKDLIILSSPITLPIVLRLITNLFV